MKYLLGCLYESVSSDALCWLHAPSPCTGPQYIGEQLSLGFVESGFAIQYPNKEQCRTRSMSAYHPHVTFGMTSESTSQNQWMRFKDGMVAPSHFAIIVSSRRVAARKVHFDTLMLDMDAKSCWQ